MIVASARCSDFVCGTLPGPQQQLFQAENAMKQQFREGIGTSLRCSWR